jgi:predicted PurR-regulated permease PerM
MKELTPIPRWMVLGLIPPLVALNAWVALLFYQYFESLITIALTATLLSFILGYLVDLLQRFRVPRGRAVLLVVLIVLTVLVVLGVTLIPTLLTQLNELATRLPTWIDSGSQQLDALQDWAQARKLPVDIDKVLGQLEDRISALVQNLSGIILSLFVDTISRVVDILLTTALTIYLLLHGERLWDGVFQWFPNGLGPKIRSTLRINFQNYFTGQITLAALVGVIMTTAFLIIRVPFGLLFGIGIGLLALIPFGKSVGITIVSALTALKSIWLGIRIASIAIVIDQIIENAISPQLIGSFTGLNPVWILVSLLIGAKVGGVLGLVVAVPLAGSLKMLVDILRKGDDAPPSSSPSIPNDTLPSLTMGDTSEPALAD